ncbi:MAG: VacB/RNase II family 3'-5' exoribonuclease [Acidobacteria bacterium]|nr:VacB/RNase II family 3'-5' exoribonuclease [Acidobacteriota bacterium]
MPKSRGRHERTRSAAPKLITGTLRAHRDGYAFVIPDEALPSIDGDIFLPPGAAESAMHGDRVAVRIARRDARGRAEGEIVRVLTRARETVVGTFEARRHGYYVRPHDDRLRQWLDIPEHRALPKSLHQDRVGPQLDPINHPQDLNGMIVNAEIVEYPRDGNNGVGRVIEVLGHPDDFGVDVEIIIRKHGLPHRFPEPVLEQARATSHAITPAELGGREDFRAFDIVTIDGETARDFDDAVWVDRLPNGHFGLQVHIADVSHYVRPGSPIDREAAARGNSVYFPDRAIPMLPVELSTDICSLRPGEDRLVFSAILEIDQQGGTVSQRFTRGVIHSRERMTYTNVHLLLEGDPEQRQRYQPFIERFERMRELAELLNRRRVRRGAIDFDLPEPLIEFDEFGQMIGVRRGPRNIAHRIIEELMLAANEAVASHLSAAGIPSLYRIHEEPDPARVLEFEEFASRFGVTLGMGAMPVKKHVMVARTRDGRKIHRDIVLAAGSGGLTSRHYQKLVQKIEGKPEERIISYMMLRSLKQARYSEEDAGHFALAAESYTHFTSPIRRYPDLIVHRVLAASLAALPAPYDEKELAGLAAATSDTERRAAAAERDLVEWKKARFMAAQLGEEFEGLIVSVTRFGFFVELKDLFVEGLVPIELLPGDRFSYEENARRIIGARSRRHFSAGDAVRVVLARVDARDNRLTFMLAAEPGAEGRRKRSKRVATAGEDLTNS